MKCDYQIEDVLRQTDEFLIYQATGQDGAAYTLTRLKYPSEILDNLGDGRFDTALNELKLLNHSCLRPIVDGGLDPVDHQPWIATRAWEGRALSDLHAEEQFTTAHLQRLEVHGKSLIADVVENAGALDFRASEIILSTASNGEAIVTFAIDYLVWFRDLAMGYQPGYKRDAKKNFQALLASLAPSQKSVSTVPLTTAAAVAGTAARSTTLPSPPTVLASAKGHENNVKSGLFIAVLSLLVAGGSWWAIQINKDKKKDIREAEPEISAVKTALPLPPKEKNLEPILSTGKGLAKIEEPPEIVVPTSAATPKSEPQNSPKTWPRPPAGTMNEISATDHEGIAHNLGLWVILKGSVKDADNTPELTFEGSELRASVLKGSISKFSGKTVSMVGRIENLTTLIVEKAEDIETFVEIATLPKKESYTVEDEAQLRTLAGQDITLEAEIKNVKASTSGKTLYLVFNETKPEFAAAVQTRYAEEGLDRAYLNALSGKTLRVAGKVKVEKGWGGQQGRLLITFRQKAHLTVVE